MEMKMVTLVKVSLFLVVATASAPSASAPSASAEALGTERNEAKAEEAVPADGLQGTLEPSTEKSRISETAARGALKYSGPERERAERVGKPFFYGRRFELRKDAKKNDGGGEMYSPLITNPIRALPSNSTNPDEETLKQNQNEILTSIQDFMRETTEESFKAQETSEWEGDLSETTTAVVPEEFPGGVNSSGSKSRQDGDRSLLVVLPFKAEGQNVEELFTKSPLVKVIEDDGLDNKEGTTPTSPVTREREITTPKAQEDVVTRKRWRPSQRYRTTTEASTPQTTTEEIRAYTNYDDVELVTRKFENPAGETKNSDNHKYDADFVTPNPVYKRFRNKTKKDQPKAEEREENTTTEGVVPPSSTEKPKEVKSKLKRKGIRRKPTTEGPPKPEDLTKILDILPTNVKDLILHMGLNKANKEQEASTNNFRLERPPQPVIDPMSYAVFKPLPLEGQKENRNFVPDDMKDFLASFGLLPMGGRAQKSLEVQPPPTPKKPVENLSGVNLDFLPDDLKAVLHDMGLVKSEDKKEPTRIHIFNPNNHSIAHSEDYEKLNAILSSIKTTVNKSQPLTPEMQSEIIEKIRDLDNLRYKNENISEVNEIKKIENKTSGDTKHRITAKRATKLNEGPDPLMFSDESLLKNDVKRQDNSTNTSFASSSASSSSSGGGPASASSSSSSSSASGDVSASPSGAASASSSSSSSASASGDVSASPSEAASASSASSSSSSSDSGDVSAASAAGGDVQTTTEEAPNIEALKESFGGGETASDEADIESSLPPKRPNGLYLLLDWNSFLEVGTEDDSRRVNLRFQPKIGDSRNFLPVSVP